jgi:hypothetical protein
VATVDQRKTAAMPYTYAKFEDFTLLPYLDKHPPNVGRLNNSFS